MVVHTPHFCRTGGGTPILAAGGKAGSVTVWNLESRKLQTVLSGAHSGPLSKLFFFPGEPVLMTSAADNALKQFIFDNEDGSGRLLRFRSGHGAPPHKVMFYGTTGNVLLSAAADQALRVFSVIQDQQSRELSQVRLCTLSGSSLSAYPVSGDTCSSNRRTPCPTDITMRLSTPTSSQQHSQAAFSNLIAHEYTAWAVRRSILTTWQVPHSAARSLHRLWVYL